MVIYELRCIYSLVFFFFWDFQDHTADFICNYLPFHCPSINSFSLFLPMASEGGTDKVSRALCEEEWENDDNYYPEAQSLSLSITRGKDNYMRAYLSLANSAQYPIRVPMEGSVPLAEVCAGGRRVGQGCL